MQPTRHSIRHLIMRPFQFLYMLGLFLMPFTLFGQIEKRISKKVTISVNTNIETYFIAEKLAVEHIGNYVFSNKDIDFSHQPIVYFAQKHFGIWKDSPTILRISSILKELRETLHDNSQILEYLLYRNEFPKSGFRRPVPNDLILFDEKKYPGAKKLGLELTDSLISFYLKAKVGDFLKNNTAFYRGAISEAEKHINAKAIPFMEKWYGSSFAAYELYLMPGMPITPGDDNYRAFGPMLDSPEGKISAMVFSSSIQLPLLSSLSEYTQYGFDNAEVTRFLTVHEIGHSFVNPLLLSHRSDIDHDHLLFTPNLAKSLEQSYISNWEVCLIEHLVRLGEIRTARAMGNKEEETRLRTLHTKTFGFILLPILEQKITEYENNRKRYPNFKSFLPEIFKLLHGLKPKNIDALVKAHKKHD
jgi:Domain of unknown function (DUF4932)